MLYWEEPSAKNVVHKFSYSKVLFKGDSDFQAVEVIETDAYGKILLLDRQIQSSELDEFIYHETLVHTAMLAHAHPKRVFIGGGGEGATAREVLKHASVEECLMVDIDAFAAKKHLQQWHKGAFEDKRFTLIVDDAKKILESYRDDYFDVIILDLSDPLDFGPCYKLYSTEFYETCKKKLTANGIFTTQSGPASLHTCTDVFSAIHHTLIAIFPHVFPFITHIPSFTNLWGFNIALKADSNGANAKLPVRMDRVQITAVDDIIAKRLGPNVLLRHYDGTTHQHMFSVPKYIRQCLDNEKRIICEETPIYMSHMSE